MLKLSIRTLEKNTPVCNRVMNTSIFEFGGYSSTYAASFKLTNPTEGTGRKSDDKFVRLHRLLLQICGLRDTSDQI